MTDLLRGVSLEILLALDVVALVAAADDGHHYADKGSIAGLFSRCIQDDWERDNLHLPRDCQSSKPPTREVLNWQELLRRRL